MKKTTLLMRVLSVSVLFLISSLFSQTFLLVDRGGSYWASGSDSASNCEDFESYNAGDHVAVVVPGWITWSNNPGSAEDAIITSAQAHSPVNSFLVEDSTDLVGLFGDENLSSGVWYYSNYMYVPAGYTGYFNLQTDVVPGVGWGFEAFFDADGSATNTTWWGSGTSWTYTFDEWHFNELIVDFDHNHAKYFFDGDLIDTWRFWRSLGGANYYAWSGLGDPMAYFDDICFEEYTIPICDDFDDYVAGDLLCTQSNNLWTRWANNVACDAYITNEMSVTAPNSVSIDSAVLPSHIVYDLFKKHWGSWAIELDIYVPEGGFCGTYSVMQNNSLFGGPHYAGFQVYFRSDGTGFYYDSEQNATEFTYNVGEWNHSVLNVDLDSNLAQYEINGDYFEVWQWSLGPQDYVKLASVDIYADAVGNDDPKFYVDNLCFKEAEHLVGIEDPIVSETVAAYIYPNPAKDLITIESESIIDEVRVYNSIGQLVYSDKYGNKQMMVNTSSFIHGMYIVEVTVKGRKVRQKLLVE